MRFGCATRDITPDRPVWLGGYGGRGEPSIGVSEPLQAGCIAVEGFRDTALIVTLDLLGVPDVDARALAFLIAAATGVPEERILLACSHTHYAPHVGPQRSHSRRGRNGIITADADYVGRMTAAVVQACAEAVRRMAFGVVEVLRTSVPQVHYNSRIRQRDGSVRTTLHFPTGYDPLPALSPTDDRLTVVRFRVDGYGAPGAMLVHFGCHPVTGDRYGDVVSSFVSSDFVHYLRRALVEEYGCPVFFAQAAAGDIVPMRRGRGARRWIGETLAHAVLLNDPAFRHIDVHRVSVRQDELRLRVRHDLSGDPEARLATATERLRAASGHEGYAAGDAWREALNLAYAARRWPEGGFTARIQHLRIGDLPLVALPFEVMAELGLRVRQDFPDALVILYANGYEGYLPFRHDFDAGGYETQTDSAHFEPGAAERILDLVLRDLKREQEARATAASMSPFDLVLRDLERLKELEPHCG